MGAFRSQVAALKKVNKEELLDFVAQNIARNSPNRRKLSIQVYGGQHLAEFNAAMGEALQEDDPKPAPVEDAAQGDGAVRDNKAPPRAAADRIDNVYTFKRSQELYESLRGGKHPAYA
jgi:insulysin